MAGNNEITDEPQLNLSDSIALLLLYFPSPSAFLLKLFFFFSQIIIVIDILSDCMCSTKVKGLENGWHAGSCKLLNNNKNTE